MLRLILVACFLPFSQCFPVEMELPAPGCLNEVGEPVDCAYVVDEDGQIVENERKTFLIETEPDVAEECTNKAGESVECAELVFDENGNPIDTREGPPPIHFELCYNHAGEEVNCANLEFDDAGNPIDAREGPANLEMEEETRECVNDLGELVPCFLEPFELDEDGNLIEPLAKDVTRPVQTCTNDDGKEVDCYFELLEEDGGEMGDRKAAGDEMPPKKTRPVLDEIEDEIPPKKTRPVLDEIEDGMPPKKTRPVLDEIENTQDGFYCLNEEGILKPCDSMM